MSARRSMLWMLGGNVSFFVVQFGGSIVLARLLSAAEMGIYAIAMSVMWLLNSIQNLGFSTYLAREPEVGPEKLGTVLTLTGLQSLLLASLLWLLAPVIAQLVGDARIAHSLRILCIFALVSPFMGTLSGLYQRRMRFDLFSIVSFLDVTIAAGVTIGLALAGFSYASMPWGAAAGTGIATLLSLWLLRRDLRVPITLSRWREVWGFGSQMLMTGVIASFCARTPDLILGRLQGVAPTGLYNRGTGLIDTFYSSVVVSIQRVMQTLLVQQRDQTGTLREGYLHAVRLVTGLLWPAFAGLAVLAGPVITLLYGDKWIEAAPVLSLICVAALVDMALCCRAQVLITAGQVRLLPRIEIVVGLMNLAMFAVGAWFGITAAAFMRVVGNLFAVLVYAPKISAASGVGASDLLRAYGKSAVVSLAAMLPSLIVMQSQGWPASLPASQLIGAIVAGLLAWLLMVYLVRHEIQGEIDVFLRSMLLSRLRRTIH